jgi:putative copper export protein
MNFARFLMLLSLGVWIGGLVFLPIVAQISFSELPSPHLAGIVVRRSPIALHRIGLVGGAVFLICSLLEGRITQGKSAVFCPIHIIVALMMALTAISQFRIIPKMDALRTEAGEISTLSADSPVRKQFDFLHAASARVEGAVLILGIVLLYLTTRRPSAVPRA